MTRVIFFFGVSSRFEAAVDWLSERDLREPPVLVYTASPDAQHIVDRMLWTRRALGFTPHCPIDSPLATDTPILLTNSLTGSLHDHCLLNLSDEAPEGFSRFSQLVEFVSTDEEQRLAGRERFKFYRSRGYPMETVDLAQGKTH